MPEVTVSLTDLKLKEYKIIVIDVEQHVRRDLSQLLTGLNWSYDIDQPTEQWNISLLRVDGIGSWTKPGDLVYVYGWLAQPDGIYWGRRKKLTIIEPEFSSEQGGDVKLTCEDLPFYLLDEGSYTLSSETASQFITRICGIEGIPTGNIIDTGVMLGQDRPEVFVNRSLWDIFVTTLAYTKDLKPDSRFLLRENDGKLDLVGKFDPSFTWRFEAGKMLPDGSWRGNILSSTNRFSLRNYKNVVRVYKPIQAISSTTDDLEEPTLLAQIPPIGKEQDDVDIGRYGVLSKSVTLQLPGDEELDQGTMEADAQQQAEKLYKKVHRIENIATFTSVNINTLRAGDPVTVYDTTTGIKGKYYVKSGSHTVTDNEASMVITVRFEDALPEEYLAKEEEAARRPRATTTTALVDTP